MLDSGFGYDSYPTILRAAVFLQTVKIMTNGRNKIRGRNIRNSIEFSISCPTPYLNANIIGIHTEITKYIYDIHLNRK
jgi:hypothetical protein